MADYILTYSKTKFYPLEPNSEDIKIIDIAHALSLMARANGHFKHFYSVAQHSINCYKEAKLRGYSKRVQLGCLLHDASESYISDLTRPVKKNLRDYFAIEEKLQGLIYEKFGLSNLSEEEISQIRDVDDAMLYYEFIELMDEKIFDIEPFISMKHDFSQRDFKTVEDEFIKAWEILT
jgi:5'-deoxynucleotidase YfbR-like HD superfamily hydrolase